tara:strand:- start:12 stop:194 length:183 start_codon:yes stop_codon:yes gene_type:complete
MNYAALIVIVFTCVWYWHIDEQIMHLVPASDTERAIRWAQHCYYEGGKPEECVQLWRDAR